MQERPQISKTIVNRKSNAKVSEYLILEYTAEAQ